MKALLVLRHAKSSWKNSGVDDHDRPLKKRGRRASTRVGRLLLEQNLMPDLIVSSTAVRAVETVRLLVEACGYRGDRHTRRELYLARPDAYVDAVRELGGAADRVLVVGHNPGLQALVVGLTGQDIELKTATLVLIEFPIDHWGASRLDGRGQLLQFWTPESLERA